MSSKTKLCSYTLDEYTIFRLAELDKMMNVKSNLSRVIRDVIEKEYTFRMGLQNASA